MRRGRRLVAPAAAAIALLAAAAASAAPPHGPPLAPYDGSDPAYTSFIPEPFRDYFNPSGGSGVADFQFDPDPSCAARVDTPAKAAKVYRSSSAAAPQRAPVEACAPASGSIRGRRLGPLA